MRTELNKKGVKMNNKDYYFAFDYDNTLAKKRGKINPTISKILLDSILRGNKVAIITSRSMFWLKKKGINILDMILSKRKDLSIRDIKELTKNFIIYTGRGNEKFFPAILNKRLVLSEDTKYNKFMTMEDKFKIKEIIKKALPKKALSKKPYTKQYFSNNSEGVIRVIIKVKNIELRLRRKIMLKIKSDLKNMKKKKFSNILIGMDEDYIGFSFKDKSFAIKDILKDNPRKIVYYYGDSPKGNDKPIFELANGNLRGKLNFISVKNPVHTLSLIKSQFNDLKDIIRKN